MQEFSKVEISFEAKNGRFYSLYEVWTSYDQDIRCSCGPLKTNWMLYNRYPCQLFLHLVSKRTWSQYYLYCTLKNSPKHFSKCSYYSSFNLLGKLKVWMDKRGHIETRLKNLSTLGFLGAQKWVIFNTKIPVLTPKMGSGGHGVNWPKFAF